MHLDDDLINNLPAADAMWTSSSKEACLTGTREEMIKSITESLSKPDFRFTWVCGSPGTGKSALAKTICGQLKPSQLAASFFFDKRGGGGGDSDSETGNSRLFVTTLARQLAKSIPPYRIELGKALEQDSLIPRRTLSQQMKLLIIQPMQRCDLSCFTHPITIALDALDECGDRKALNELITLIVEFDNLPSVFTVFFTCRPQPAVLQTFELGETDVKTRTTVKNLDHISEESTNADLARFVNAEIGKMKNFHSDEPWPPKPRQIDKFARRSGGLFEIAALRLRRIDQGPDIGNTYAFVFDKILEETDEQSPSYEEGLDGEYFRILDLIYPSGPTYRSADVAEALKKYREVVGALFTLLYPISTEALAALIGMEKTKIRAVLRPLSAILYISVDESEDVYPYHASFQEFLMKIPENPTPRQLQFVFDGPQHRSMAQWCLERMVADLKQDMCQIEKDNVPLGHPGNLSTRHGHIPDHMWYAIIGWAYHLDERDGDQRLQEQTETFMKQSLMYWIETLAWMKELTEGNLMLQHYESWYKVRSRAECWSCISLIYSHRRDQTISRISWNSLPTLVTS
jgi:hypothetical protein